MARARNLKPGFFFNVELAQLDPLVRLLFVGTWTVADREGRFKDQPLRIKAETLPYDELDVDDALNQLQEKGFIARYQVNGCKYIQIQNWLKHQNPHMKERESEIPAPEKHRASTRKAPEKHSTNPSDSLNPITDSLNLRLATLLFTLIQEHNANTKEPDIQAWAVEIGRIIRIDKRDPQELEVIIRWCQSDDFWYANILSARKLREKYDTLVAHMDRDLKKKQPTNKKCELEKDPAFLSLGRSYYTDTAITQCGCPKCLAFLE